MENRVNREIINHKKPSAASRNRIGTCPQNTPINADTE